MDSVQTKKPYRLRVLNIYKETIADGFGLRYSIYFAGCIHACPGCHNPGSWSPCGGRLLTDEWLEEIIQEVNANPLLDGITLSGGDPFYCPPELLRFLQIFKAKSHHSVWCYTGYRYEELLEDVARKACLPYIDVLVDGRFEIALFDPYLQFRGSSNQRIIHLRNGQIDFIE